MSTPEDNHDGYHLGFPVSPELAQEALATIDRIREEPASKESRKAMIDCVLKLTEAGLEAYYLRSLEKAGLSGLALGTARLGIKTARGGIATIANQLVKAMSEEQLLSVADSMEGFLFVDE